MKGRRKDQHTLQTKNKTVTAAFREDQLKPKSDLDLFLIKLMTPRQLCHPNMEMRADIAANLLLPESRALSDPAQKKAS